MYPIASEVGSAWHAASLKGALTAGFSMDKLIK
jgi:hypothetical protein